VVSSYKDVASGAKRHFHGHAQTLLKPDDGPNERKPQRQAWPNVLFDDGRASRNDGAGQACRPYLSATAAATNVLRPALPGLVRWAAHQSGNVAGSM
jgi:hypothetical protein